MKAENEPVVVAVSGGFDPVHIGHIRHFKEARSLGDKLIVILNDDEWLMRKKGYVFMPIEERKELLESLRYVDEVIVREPAPDMTMIHMLAKLPVHIYAKGGDRNAGNVPELDICNERGIRVVFGVGGSDKPQSSSWLAENAAKRIKDSGKLRDESAGV